MATIKEFRQALNMIKNIKEGDKIGRFKFTTTEMNCIDFVIEYMTKSLEDSE